MTAIAAKPRATPCLAARARALIPLGALFAYALVRAGFLNYDTAYALLWGGDLVHGRTPQYDVTLAPTAHPLATLLGAILTPLGDASQPVWVVIAFLALGAVGWLTFELANHWFGTAAGIVAALLILTRVPLLSFGVRAYVDIPYVALALGAILAEAKGPKPRLTLTLLALAGLPETRGVAALARLRRLPPRPQAAPLALAAPVLWAGYDLVITGDPLHSLTGTREGAEVLQRKTGLTAVPTVVPRRLGEILRADGLLAAAAGGILVLVFMRKAAKLPIAAGFASVVAFCVLAVAGLPILGRYLLLPAALLAVFAGAGVFGWTRLERAHPWRTRWMAIGAVCALAIVALTPSQISPPAQPARRAAHPAADPGRPEGHDRVGARSPRAAGRSPSRTTARSRMWRCGAGSGRAQIVSAQLERPTTGLYIDPGERAGGAQLHARPQRPEEADREGPARLHAGGVEPLLGALLPLPMTPHLHRRQFALGPRPRFERSVELAPGLHLSYDEDLPVLVEGLDGADRRRAADAPRPAVAGGAPRRRGGLGRTLGAGARRRRDPRRDRLAAGLLRRRVRVLQRRDPRRGADAGARRCRTGSGWTGTRRRARPWRACAGCCPARSCAAARPLPRPLPAPKPQPPEALLQRMQTRLITGLQRLSAKGTIALPLTGGHDSRTLLATAVAAGVHVEAYTLELERIASADRDLPPRLAAAVGVPHRYIRPARPPDPRRLALWDEHTAGHAVDADRELFAKGQLDRAGDVRLRPRRLLRSRPRLLRPRPAGASARHRGHDPARAAVAERRRRARVGGVDRRAPRRYGLARPLLPRAAARRLAGGDRPGAGPRRRQQDPPGQLHGLHRRGPLAAARDAPRGRAPR